ncbi:E3 ubiquitin-protein ligase TRIM9 [Fasciolopsis buskii]|uniref:E3 ubiquitin-protein ligase TRIM9 n=1 Tax=Fasciolopsis buskii TaxID=27845 RepID=A0A8E0RPT1_9TREM|nr:E3 ubiquitin-protein ligase TRIM9 [Fasciolopsis buski]
MLSRTESENPRPAASVTSLLSSSSNSSGASGTSASGQSTSLAAATAVHKMDAELRCPACHRYFHCPLLLPCGHSLCTACAAGALLPSTEPSVAASILNIMNLVSSAEGYRVLIPGAPYSSSSSASSTTGSSIVGTAQTNIALGTVPVSQHPAGSSHSDSDQLSVVSETDSGVVVSSRPGSYIGRLPAVFCQSAITAAAAAAAAAAASSSNSAGVQNTSNSINLSTITHGLVCPSCNRTVGLFDEQGLSQLPRNRALERVISKFVSPDLLQEKTPVEIGTFPLLSPSDPISRPGGPLCQLCEEPENPSEQTVDSRTDIPHSSANLASVWCEQCEIFYCTPCRERCHPSRGPLMRHGLHTASKGVEITKHKRQHQLPPCPLHPHMLISLFCMQCQTQVCNECLSLDGNLTRESHSKHEILPVNTICKARKVSINKNFSNGLGIILSFSFK